MFCRLTYYCIQFIQRMIPPLSINYKTKPFWLSQLYKRSGRLSTILYAYSGPKISRKVGT